MNLKSSIKKLSWVKARKHFLSICPVITKLIDNLDPCDNLPIYICRYPYGSMIINQGTFYVPNEAGQIVPIADASISNTIKNDLNFNGTIPVGFVLTNSIESFMTSGNRVTPFTLFGKGNILGLWRVFDKGKSYQHAPFWGISSGSRSICILPKISDQNSYRLLKRKFNLATEGPKNLSDHWQIFKYLANHKSFPQPWYSEIIYFSKEWFNNKNDPSWIQFYHHLQKTVWQESSFTRNKIMFDYFFSIIQEKRNLKPNPYLADTLSHLMTICSGEAPGFIPAYDNSAAPIIGLQQVFLEDYKLKKYSPVIMHTHHLSSLNPIPVYYSFGFPTTIQFSPKSNNTLTTMAQIREIKHITNILLSEIRAGELGIERTPLFDLALNLDINFYHNEKDAFQEISPIKALGALDDSMRQTLINEDKLQFPESSPFFRGCIRLEIKN